MWSRKEGGGGGGDLMGCYECFAQTSSMVFLCCCFRKLDSAVVSLFLMF